MKQSSWKFFPLAAQEKRDLWRVIGLSMLTQIFLFIIDLPVSYIFVSLYFFFLLAPVIGVVIGLFVHRFVILPAGEYIYLSLFLLFLGVPAVGIVTIGLFAYLGILLRRFVILPGLWLWETKHIVWAAVLGILCGANPWSQYMLIGREQSDLFFVTLGIVGVKRISRDSSLTLSSSTMWVSLLLANMLRIIVCGDFLLYDPTVFFMLVSNFATRIVFGWIYCRYGFLSCVVAHTTTCLVMLLRLHKYLYSF